MSQLYFVRHGQSKWNVSGQICGATDIPLTDAGREQARQTANVILESHIHVDLMLCSPLSRAAETARIIAEMTGFPLQVEPRLIEQNFGRYEGTDRHGAEFTAAKAQLVQDFGGGESMMRVAHRVYSVLDELTAQPEKTYMIVAHNGIARIVKSYFCNMTNEEFAAFGVKNCSLTTFDF